MSASGGFKKGRNYTAYIQLLQMHSRRQAKYLMANGPFSKKDQSRYDRQGSHICGLTLVRKL